MTRQYKAEFITVEEYHNCTGTQKQFISIPYINYLLIEPLKEIGMVLKAKLLYRHASLYHLNLGNWCYLNQNDLRSIVPIKEYKENNKMFYIRYGVKFFEVKNILTNQENILEFILQEANNSNLN